MELTLDGRMLRFSHHEKAKKCTSATKPEVSKTRVSYSKQFIDVLHKMKDNKIASTLLSIHLKDVDIQYNYVDITDEKDVVSFTPNNKILEIVKGLKGKPETWVVNRVGKILNHKEINDEIFVQVDYTRDMAGSDDGEHWSPNVGEVGVLFKSCVSPKERTYFLFQEYVTGSSKPRYCVINKKSIELDRSGESKIWKTSRNNIKIGRLVRSILSVVNYEFIDKDIEEFTNHFKATYDFTKDKLKQFGLVEGKDISHWYNYENYMSGGGTMNNSCMSRVDKKRFCIYTKNPNQVKLLILYDDNGILTPDGYTSTKIKGRAIVWDAKIDGKSQTFMDRIYTVNDSDTELFRKYAQSQGWWYKVNQSMNPDEQITNGTERKQADISVQLEKSDFETFPFTDTMCYLNINKNKVRNISRAGYNVTMRNT